MTELERVLLESDLHRVVCRYARLCDERDWAAIGDVFSENASADYGGRHLSDPPAIVAMLSTHLDGCGPTQHLLGNLVVEVAGDVVSSRVSVRAAHLGAGELHEQTYDCMGEYHDRWTRTDRGWRIVHRRMQVGLEFGSRTVLRPVR